VICADCEGKGIVIALVDGTHYCGPMCVSCSRCEGTGEADPQTEGLEIGDKHQMAELSALGSGRADPPRRVLLDMLEKLRATDGGGTAPGGALSPQQLDELLKWLRN